MQYRFFAPTSAGFAVNTRILHVLDHLQPSAALSRLLMLARRLPGSADHGHRFTVVSLQRINGRPECVESAKRMAAAGIQVETVSQAAGWDPLAPVRLRRLVSRLQPELIHIWQPAGLAWARMAAAGRPLIASIDNWPGRYDRWQLSLMRSSIRHVDAVVVPNELVAAQVRKYLAARDEQLTIIAPGVEPPAASQSSGASREALFAAAQLPADARVIAAVGRLVPCRRVRDAIWNIDILSLLFLNSYLVILGDGPQKRRLQAFNRALRGWAHTRFVSWQNPADWWPHVELVFHFDDEPGISQSLLEAMAAGKPVIASDTASHRAFLEDGVHTHFAALNDRTSLAKCGRRLLLDPAAAAAIGAAGQARVLERFGADAFVEAHRQLYDSLAAGARASLAIRSA